MNSLLRKPELLSPAGWFDSLVAAVENGADAIYFGVSGFNMRANARNFKASEMEEVADYCHARGVKAYLALNSIIYDNEIRQMQRLVRAATDAGIDGIICWDLSVVEEALRAGIPVHLSTQMSVANSATILHFYKGLGIKRFVLARELTLAHIRAIRRRLRTVLGKASQEIELETFIHGAMCVSISGRCYISQFLHGKSANRGECLQPCRRQYMVTDRDQSNSLIIEGGHILSPKDLCTLPFIEKLIEAGIASFKIEGRNRKPDYVAVVTRAYRTAIDFYFENRGCDNFAQEFEKLKKELVEQLRSVFNRGFSSGFYHGIPLNAWTDSDGNKSHMRREYVGKVVNFYRKIGVAEIDLEARGIKAGELLLIEGKHTGARRQEALSLQIDHRPVSQAEKGERVACKLEFKARPNDKVFILTEDKGRCESG